MTGKLTLVPDDISHDTVEALEEMLVHARAGKLKGFAFVASMRRGHYIRNVAGDLRLNPTLARGMLCTLDDFLASQPHK